MSILTTCSAINQQIALKTVAKLGFSVNAVWNGQEALDYLLKEQSADHPKPDIILMDVQMPLMSGYSATHRIRHHSPYTSIDNIRAIPIVAMTASAIQGDREKCKRAGMDDYLAKPVKAKTLEKMLVKWALVRKNPKAHRVPSAGVDQNSECTDPDHNPSIEVNTPDSENSKAARAIAESSVLPGIESEGDRGMQRVEAEEKATYLRDYKLLAASEAHLLRPRAISPAKPPSVRPNLPITALTEENIGILDRELDETMTDENLPTLNREKSGAHSSMDVGSWESSPAGSTVGELKVPIKQGRSWGARAVRSRLSRNDSDRSQRTVIPND